MLRCSRKGGVSIYMPSISTVFAHAWPGRGYPSPKAPPSRLSWLAGNRIPPLLQWSRHPVGVAKSCLQASCGGVGFYNDEGNSSGRLAEHLFRQKPTPTYRTSEIICIEAGCLL